MNHLGRILQQWIPLGSESSLSRDFALVSGLILLLVLFLSSWLTWEAFDSHEGRMRQHATTEARALDQHIQGIMDSTSYVLESLARQVDLFGETDHTQIARLLTSFDTMPDVYGAFAWINKKQQIKISSNHGVIEIPTASVADEEYQKRAMAYPWKAHVGRPVPGRRHQQTMPMVIGLTNDTGRYIGTLLISLDIDQIIRRFASSHPAQDYAFAVISRHNGQLMGKSANASSDLPALVEAHREFLTHAPNNASQQVLRLENGYEMVAYQSAPDSPYVVAVHYVRTSSLGAVFDQIFPRILQIGITASFLLVVLWLIRHRLIRPVVALSDTAAALARGQSEIDVNIHGPVEITQLALQIQRIKEYILERKMIEDELRRKTVALKHAKEESELADRIKSEFLACISHELRTPLNAIIGFSDVMLKEYYGPLSNERYTQYVTDIRTSGQHLLEIINDILDLAKVEAGAMSLNHGEANLGQLIEKTSRLLNERALQSGITLESVVPPNLPHIMVDALRIKQVLINLVSNAIKFTGKGGRVVVEAEYLPHEPLPIRVHIRDNGIGMTPEDIPIALSKFGQVQSANKTQSGTGLGLPLSKELMLLHQGDLLLHSEAGKGTTVTVLLPAARVILTQQAA